MIVKGEIESPVTYQSALRDQDVFVHIAALVKMWARDSAQFDRVNVDATEKAIRMSADAGIQKFIYASSFIALGPSNGTLLKEDDAAPQQCFAQ